MLLFDFLFFFFFVVHYMVEKVLDCFDQTLLAVLLQNVGLFICKGR